MTTVAAAVQDFAQRHNIRPLTSSVVHNAVGDVATGDYDALYEAVAKLLPFVPEDLQERLYEISSNALARQASGGLRGHSHRETGQLEDDSHSTAGDLSFTALREACAKYLPRQRSTEVRNIPATDYAQREQNSRAGGMESLSKTSSERSFSGYPPPALSVRYSSTYGVHDQPEVQDSFANGLGETRQETRSTRETTKTRWTLPDDSGFVRPKSRHGTPLSCAGLFPYSRQFGVPYFAVPPPPDSHMLHGDSPTNGDVVANAQLCACERRGLTDAHRPGRRKWTSREVDLLREVVAMRAGASEQEALSFAGSEECRKIADGWNEEVWESLAQGVGTQLGGRDGCALMCKYLNQGSDVWADGKDSFLRDEEAVKACLRDLDGGWEVVGAAAHRRGIDCLRRYCALNQKRSGPWTAEEDKKLKHAVDLLGRRWRAVSLVMGTRSGPQCLHRYEKQLSKRNIGKWTPEEVETLKEVVDTVGHDWAEVARRVGTRNDVQCREKWVCGLAPGVRRGHWTASEDLLLKIAVQQKGEGSWSKVAQSVPGRVDVQCRRRWVLLQQTNGDIRKDRFDNPLLPATKQESPLKGQFSQANLGSCEPKKMAEDTHVDVKNSVDQASQTKNANKATKQEPVIITHLTKDAEDARSQATKRTPAPQFQGQRFGKWTVPESKRLIEVMAEVGRDWMEVAKRVGTRSDVQCREKWVRGLVPGDRAAGWTDEEDGVLRDAVTKIGEGTWEKIAELVPGRTDVHCRQRWQFLYPESTRTRRVRLGGSSKVVTLVPGGKKIGRWSNEEIKRLQQAVAEVGDNWREVGKRVATRADIQCREKWMSGLDEEGIFKWSKEEDVSLRVSIATVNGSDWVKVAENLPGRTSLQCEQRWKVLQDRQEDRGAVPDKKTPKRVLQPAKEPARRKQGRWSLAEMQRLEDAMAKVGQNWMEVAKHVRSRNDVQCQDKWTSELKAGRNDANWTAESDALLKSAVQEFETDWKAIADVIAGRTKAECRRRWRALEYERLGRVGELVGEKRERTEISTDEEPATKVAKSDQCGELKLA